jgi:potassium channel subfamily K
MLTLLQDVLEPSTLTHNNHDKNHLIIQAIKSIAHDHIYAQTNKERPSYAFEDWEYIFYLMGILNSNDEDSETTMPQLGDRDRGASENAEIGEGQTRIESWQGEEHILDWLHGKNPLNVSETLTEWMLLTLVERLEGELGELREKLGRRPSGGQRPDGRAFEGINLAPQG